MAEVSRLHAEGLRSIFFVDDHFLGHRKFAMSLLAELARFCEARLPYFAVPRYLDLMPDLPRTENGKVQKYKLRERGVLPQTWDREKAMPGRTGRRRS